MPLSMQQRATTHYLATLLFIGLYGTQVCPFIDGLSTLQLSIPLLFIVTIQFTVRQLLISRLKRLSCKQQLAHAFTSEWFPFIFAGLLLTLSNSLFYDFPLESGLKMILGFTAIGFYAAIDLTLAHQRRIADLLQQRGEAFSPDRRYTPLVTKFALFASLSILFLIAIFLLVLNKDLAWLGTVGDQLSSSQAMRSVLVEFLFIGLLLLGYLLLVIGGYARNLNLYFGRQNGVMAKVTDGRLDHRVTVSSNDEFGEMAHHTNVMIATLMDRTEALQRTQDVTIHSLASLAETRDNETGAHVLRTQRYICALAEALRDHPRFRDELTDANIELLFKSAPLHDIGKVGIPDAILLKPGKLDDVEFNTMKGHTVLGMKALERAEGELGSSSFLYYAREIAYTHHEKWDGSGYPRGLAGDAIPISGRLMAVADVYDALISKRVYKPAFSHDKAMAIIREGRGSHFDPDIIDTLLRIEPQFVQIARDYADQ